MKNINVEVSVATIEDAVQKAVRQALYEEAKIKVHINLKEESLEIAKKYLETEEMEQLIQQILKEEVRVIARNMAKRSSQTIRTHIRQVLSEIYEVEIDKKLKESKNLREVMVL